jgi:hypothetical protein
MADLLVVYGNPPKELRLLGSPLQKFLTQLSKTEPTHNNSLQNVDIAIIDPFKSPLGWFLSEIWYFVKERS